MKENIIKRLLQVVPMLIIISIIAVKERLGLKEPIYIQYIKWMKNVLKGDMGYSLVDHKPVTKIILNRLPATIGLMGISLVLSLLISIPVGLYTGKNKNKIIDNIVSIISYIGISIPSFWFGIMLIYLFSLKLKLLPSGGIRTLGVERSIIDTIKHGILPCTVLVFYSVSVYTRYIRSSTIAQLNENYVKTEEAYGFSDKKIMLKYVLKNVLLPVITILGMNLPSLMTGAFVTETVFSWPGMGRLGVTSIFSYDYPVIMATTMITSILLILGNLLADILYSIVDPRISSKG